MYVQYFAAAAEVVGHDIACYFALLGQQKQPDIPMVHKPLRSSFSDDPKETTTASDILNEAITDIAILPNGECVS
jgi:hypothetical protein